MHIRVGDYDCWSLSDGSFRLDGGAMFGVVPKVMWNRISEADADNRIRLGLTSLLIAGRGMTMLIEGGVGDVFDRDEKLKRIYAVESCNLLEEGLRAAGFSPGDVTTVTYSHLHWDHAGPACRIGADGRYVPRFPNARYLVQKGEWEAALSGDPLTAPSYIPESLLPLAAAGQLDIICGDHRVNEDVGLYVTGGHTESHMVVTLSSRGERLIFWGDIIPTAGHINLPFIMAYDRFPVDTHRVKKEWLEKPCRDNYLSAFPHDIGLGFGSIGYDGRKYYLAGVR
jgi:glyoxylase-like metal-dependent hydrolase (beta-lactamase superfamily II)